MTLTTSIPLLVSLVGILMYLLSPNAKVTEIGRIMFAFGLLVALYSVATHVVRF